MKFIANVFENSFEDNYENGEQNGTFNRINIQTKTFETAEDCYHWFLKNYGKNGTEVVDTGSDPKIFAIRPIQSVKDNFFVNATDEEIAQWKAGKINLWNLEYELEILKVCPLSFEELETVWKNG